jgi:hypothetical protein
MKKNSIPRRKKMKREFRLCSAKTTGWVGTYQGKNIIKGYGNWFGVDFLTAITELRLLGVPIDGAREAEIRASIAARTEARKRQREALARKRFDELYADADDTFAFIAGHTPGGVPYGVTWEELGEEQPWLIEDEYGDQGCGG